METPTGRRTVVSRVIRPATMFGRMRGLLGRKGLDPEEGMLLESVGPIHTIGMRFTIDVLFLDKKMNVLGTSENLKPWRFAWTPGARYVLELAAGRIQATGVKPGDSLNLD